MIIGIKKQKKQREIKKRIKIKNKIIISNNMQDLILDTKRKRKIKIFENDPDYVSNNFSNNDSDYEDNENILSSSSDIDTIYFDVKNIPNSNKKLIINKDDFIKKTDLILDVKYDDIIDIDFFQKKLSRTNFIPKGYNTTPKIKLLINNTLPENLNDIISFIKKNNPILETLQNTFS